MTRVAPNLAVLFRGLGWVTLLASLAGCASSTEAESLGVTRQAAFMNEKTVYDYFRVKGLTNFQAAGVVGNLEQESGLDPTIHQYNGGPGRGLAQWSAGARWDVTDGDNLVDFANEHGQQPETLDIQLDFIWYELTTFSNYGLAELKASATLEAATQIFEDKFEGCVYANYPECALPNRINLSKAVLAAYGDDPVPGGGGGGGGGGAAGAAGTAGSAGNAGASGGDAGGSSSGGTAPATAGAAGSSPGSAGATTAGPNGGGAPGTAGNTTTAGAPSNAGSTTNLVGLSGSNDESSCAFSRRGRSGNASILLGVLIGCGLTLRRRR